MKNINDVLYPKESSKKHPNTQEIIKIAEDSGITITEIANIMGCRQPYVSQLKAGKGKASLTKITPLINKLSSKSPGDEFSLYSVFKSAKPVFPKNWEEQVLMLGLKEVSEQDEHGRYPLGDDDFHSVEAMHYGVVDKLPEKGRMSHFSDDFPKTHFKNRLSELEEALNLYSLDLESKKSAKEKEIAQTTEEVERLINRNSHLFSSVSNEAATIEEELRKLIQERFFPSFSSNSSILQDNLIRACKAVEDSTHSYVISHDWERLDLNNFNEDAVKIDLNPALFAAQLINKCKKLTSEYERKKLERRSEHRLQKLFNSKEYSDIKNLTVTELTKLPNWKNASTSLFGGMIRKIYRQDIDTSYEVNMSKAFSKWAESLDYELEEETVQICGPVVLSKETERFQLIIHELYSQQFIVISTSHNKELKCQISEMSKAMSVNELFSHLNKSEYVKNNIILEPELTEVLSQRGYKTPGVRAIY